MAWWPRRPSRAVGLEAIGQELVTSLVFWTSWSHRRVEAVALLEGERARRRISVDLTVPDLRWPIDTPEPPHTLVPLATIAKTDMRQFDATDESGASLPILTSWNNGELSVAFLVALIEAELERPLSPADRDALRSCVFDSAPASTKRANALVERLGIEQTFGEQFLLRLAEQFILFAVLPVERVGVRTIVKFSYHWGTSRQDGLVRAVGDLARRAAAGAGLKPYELEIQLGPSDTAASIHLEVQAPPGLHCVDLTLYDNEGEVVAYDFDAGNVAHAHTSAELRPVRGSVRFDADLGGVHRLVTWSAWGVAVLLAATRWRLGTVAQDPGTPVSLLLFGPALLLTWLVRPGENWIVSAIVGPLRALALLLAGCLFAVGFGLSVGFDAPPHASGWGTLADLGWYGSIGMSVVAAIVLTFGRALIRSRLAQGDDQHG